MQICSAHRDRPGRQWRQISNYAQNKINDGQAAIWQRRWWCVPVVEQHAEWGYLWSREVAMAGNWRQAGAAHFEEWLCALLACALASSSCPGGGGGRESFDYFHRLCLIPGKGHCSLWAAETKRLALPRANNSQDRPAPKNNSPAQHTHSSRITPTLIGVEELCSASVHFLSGMAVDAALSSVSGDKEEKAACSSNRGRVGPKLEVGSASLRPI